MNADEARVRAVLVRCNNHLCRVLHEAGESPDPEVLWLQHAVAELLQPAAGETNPEPRT